MVVEISDVKAIFPKLIDQVGKGEDIIITRRGKPVAKIVGITPTAKDIDRTALWTYIRKTRDSILGFSAKEANEFRMNRTLRQ